MINMELKDVFHANISLTGIYIALFTLLFAVFTSRPPSLKARRRAKAALVAVGILVTYSGTLSFMLYITPEGTVTAIYLKWFFVGVLAAPIIFLWIVLRMWWRQ